MLHARRPRRRITTTLLAGILLPLSVLMGPAGVNPDEVPVLVYAAEDAPGPIAPAAAAGAEPGSPPVMAALVSPPSADRVASTSSSAPESGPVPGAPNLEREHVRPLIEVVDLVGVEREKVLDAGAIERAAEVLDVEIERPITSVDADRLVEAHRERVAPVLEEAGIDLEDGVDDDALLAAADVADVEVDPEDLGPGEVNEIAEAVEVWTDENLPSPLFASAEGVDIHVPSKHVVLIGFHQASFPVAKQMDAIDDGVEMTTLPSRGRGTGRRSAADVSVEPGTEVLAPVSGEVVEVQRYALYGRYPDVKVRIVPDDNPDMLVSIVHVTGAKVSVGDTVEGGVTVLAEESTQFPFASQIDRFAGRLPHAHVEIRRR
jgi:murein DD-endopeptidase MepM/ murein hydrolase activator NlpD